MTSFDPPRPWTHSYAAGVPEDLEPQTGSLVDIVDASARDYPDAPALQFFGRETTYGENIGVMAATRVYSTAVYWVAGITAIVLSLSPKVGAVFNTIPAGVLGGVTTALYGLIGIIGIKIWVDNRVDFSRPVNQYTGAVALVLAIAGFTMQWGDFQLGAIVLGSVAALLIYHLGNAIARARKTGADDGGPIPAVGPLGGDPS